MKKFKIVLQKMYTPWQFYVLGPIRHGNFVAFANVKLSLL